jgi:hypothetical protein
MIQDLAEEQDIIGWQDFLEGKISKKFYVIQRRFLMGAPSLLNGRDWVTRFISELLDISHTQWSFRNIPLHSATNGMLANSRWEQLAEEIYKLQHMNPKDILEESLCSHSAVAGKTNCRKHQGKREREERVSQPLHTLLCDTRSVFKLQYVIRTGSGTAGKNINVMRKGDIKEQTSAAQRHQQ